MSVPRYLLALLLATAGVAQAVEFDENLKAPRAANGAEVKSKLMSVAAKVTGPNAIDALASVRDPALARERFDARWALGVLIDAKAPLPELAELGFEPNGDGSYNLDTAAHPEWQPLSENLLLFADPSILEKFAPSLLARGFKSEDLDQLQTYVKKNDLKRARDLQQLSLILSASKKAKKLQKLKRLDDNFMASFFYQKQWQFSETERKWATGLLDVLEPRAQRVLASYFSEISSKQYLAPTPTADAYKYEKELLLRPDLEQMAKAAFEEGRL
jgi:hypothetical protein